MLYDLHVHSNDSDGIYSRIDLLRKANEMRFECISFTDHDYISNGNEIQKYESMYGKCNVDIISGVELTVDENKNMHILGYDIKNPIKLKNKLLELRSENAELCLDLIKNLNQYYHFDLDISEYQDYQISKGLIRRMIFDKGYANSIIEAGLKYTGVYSKFYFEAKFLKLYEIFEMVKEADGIIVLAHPSTLGISNYALDIFVKYLKELGLDGIEILNTCKTTIEQMEYYEMLARKYNLLTTCGSDFHESKHSLGIENEKSNELIRKIKER